MKLNRADVTGLFPGLVFLFVMLASLCLFNRGEQAYGAWVPGGVSSYAAEQAGLIAGQGQKEMSTETGWMDNLNPATETIKPVQGSLLLAENKPQEESEPKVGYITMNFKDVDIEVLIKFISELTGKNFVVDPAVKGRVTILSPKKVTIGEAYKVFLSVLEINDFTAVPAGKVIKIIKSSDAKGKAVETLMKRSTGAPEDKVITQLYPLKYADASDLAKLMKPLVPRTGLLIPYDETNTVIIIDMLSNIDRIIKIIDELDVPGHEEISIFMLEYARSEKLATKLKEIFQEKKGRRAAQQNVKIISDERTNALIVLASPKITADIKMLIEKLDQEEAKPKANIHIYTLENAVAEDLVKVLSEIPGKGGEEKGKQGKTTGPLISKDVQISADKATNTLVIIAEEEEYRLIEQIIKKLDIPRIMVYVEALIMEVSADKSLQLGVEWRLGSKIGGGFQEGGSGGIALAGTPGAGEVDSLGSGTIPTGFSIGVVGRAITLGDAVFPSIGAFIRAVRTDSDFNVISTPQILTLDNQEAVIEVAQNIPFVTQVVQQSTTTDRPIQSFEYRDVGVTLKVTPQINQNRFVRLNVEQNVSRVIETTALGGTVLAPTTVKRSTKSTISVRDGETAVIGGLIEDQETRGNTKTPCLGNIPGLGWAFKQINDRDQKTNLMVFLTPHIVQNPEEGKALYGLKKDYIDNQVEKSIKTNQPELIRRKAFE